MYMKDIKYMFDVSNGWFTIRLSKREVVKYRLYNNDNVIIGIDRFDDITCIRICGFRDYIEGVLITRFNKLLGDLKWSNNY